jgi:phage baseplate assembly protein W
LARSIPHIAFPLRIENGQVATVEQDSVDEVRQNVLAVLNTIVGSRIDAPEYGVPDETFTRQSRNRSADAYLRAVEDAEPRARLLGEAEIEGMIRRIVLKEAN